MLRKIIPLALVLAVGAFTYAGTSMDANTVGAQAFATESASVANGFLCGVLVALTTDSHETLSDSGKQSLSCHGFAANAGPTQHFRGLGCGFFFGGFTTNSKLVWTDTGDANLWCKA